MQIESFHLCITLVTLAIIYEIFDQWFYSLTAFFSMFFFDPLFKSPPHCWESHFICNEAKKGISKRVLQKIKCAKFSKKRNFCTPWYAHALVGKKSLWKNWRDLLSYYNRFRIHPFALFPTIYIRSTPLIKTLLRDTKIPILERWSLLRP